MLKNFEDGSSLLVCHAPSTKTFLGQSCLLLLLIRSPVRKPVRQNFANDSKHCAPVIMSRRRQRILPLKIKQMYQDVLWAHSLQKLL